MTNCGLLVDLLVVVEDLLMISSLFLYYCNSCFKNSTKCVRSDRPIVYLQSRDKMLRQKNRAIYLKRTVSQLSLFLVQLLIRPSFSSSMSIQSKKL